MKRNKLPILSEQTSLSHLPFANLDVTGSPRPEKKLASLEEPLAKISSQLILSKEKSHRAGKTVLVVTGFSSQVSDEEINGLAKDAKVACACGGTVTDRKIELQGNQPCRVRKFFESRGFCVRGVR